MFHAKVECPSMYTALDMVQSTQEYSMHTTKVGWLSLVKYDVPSSRYGLDMFHAKFEFLSM